MAWARSAPTIWTASSGLKGIGRARSAATAATAVASQAARSLRRVGGRSRQEPDQCPGACLTMSAGRLGIASRRSASCQDERVYQRYLVKCHRMKLRRLHCCVAVAWAARVSLGHPEGDRINTVAEGKVSGPIHRRPVCPGPACDRARRPARPFLPAARRADEALRRHLHQGDQDDHRADHILHGGARHRQHAGHEEGRPRRPQGADLFRGADHARADRRADRCQHPAARRRHEHRRQHHRHPLDPGLRDQVQGAEHRTVPDGHHPQHRGRRLRPGRDPAGAVLRRPVRVRPADARRARPGAARRHRPGQPRAVRRGRHHHEGGAARGLRRDGLHHRQVRRRRPWSRSPS